MSIRVVAGEIGAKDATTRTAIPTVTQPRWHSFERVAETLATPRRRFPPHRHEGVEVLTYVIEGSGSHDYGEGPATPLESGSTLLLTAPTPTAHAINPGKGQTIRWFAIIAALPPRAGTASQLQSGRVTPSGLEPEGTTVRHLVGPGAAITSAAGLESVAVEFRSDGSSFQKVGHDRAAVCYALSGRGAIDDAALEAGEAALVENAAGVALHGRRGFHAIFTSGPASP